ncbi:methyltransferase domain-containing protein, partial [Klebsiella pneumoniae]
MQFARLRQRPVVELLDHIELCCPERIYDLGCGTGIATELLARRWPLAELHGVDSSVEMLEE